MLKLTKTQAKILAEADACPDEAFEGPEGAQRAVGLLIRHGLLAVMPDESGPTRLRITPAGREELAARATKVNMAGEGVPTPMERRRATSPGKASGRGKIEMVVSLLQRPEGANLQTLVEATGWQPHSVRGALSGAIKKGRGLPIVSEVTEGVRVYRIAGQATA